MKPVLDWIKANVAIVVLTAVIILVLPLGFVGSNLWNAKIRKSREAAATRAANDLRALQVSYVLPSALPNGSEVRVPLEAPNEEYTKFFRTQRQALEKQVGEVVGIAQSINRKAPLMEGVFPKPVSNTTTWEFAERFVSRPDRPSVYQQLFKKINAGGPADPEMLARQLVEMRQQAMERAMSSAGRNQLSPEEEADLLKQMVATRLSHYRSHARTLSVYAGPECLPPSVPRALPGEPPSIEVCFAWQFDYWTIEDLLNGIAAANTEGGKLVPVTGAVVKRVERITLDPIPFAPSDPSNPTPMGPTSITGRRGGGPTGLYDLRGAHLTLIVASARVPELLNAFARTDFMGITSLSISEANVWNDLEEGFYYGTDHVVRVQLGVETVWLRSWTTELMPDSIKEMVVAAALPPEPPPPPPPPPVASEGTRRTAAPAKKNVLKKKGRGSKFDE
jgi:hypothetical protein